PAKPAIAAEPNLLRGSAATDVAAPIATPDEIVPVPLPKPAALAELNAASHAPIAIFVSRKEKKIYVRQHFAPLFATPITIDHPERPFGTHVFTAMGYQDDNATFRWNVVTLAGEQPRASRFAEDEDYGRRGGRGRHQAARAEAPVETPAP